MKTHGTKNPAVAAKGLELPIMLAPLGALSCLSGRFKAFCTTVMIVGLLVCAGGAHSQAAEPGGHAQFEPASVFVPAGNDCVLHPKDNPDPSQSIALRSDADGVVRFLAVRPTLPASIEQLTLDCTDSLGNPNTYSVDLRSDDTFVRRPFDPSLANLAFRPGLTGDPLSFTQDQLVEAGYGLRPDPTADPEGYKTWLDAVSVPAYKLKAAPRASSAPRSSHQVAAAHVSADSTPSLEPEAVFLSPSTYWTGAELTGSYQKNATSAKTYGYVQNIASFSVPKITPNFLSTKTTVATIWNGLDDVFQAIVDVAASPTAGAYGIHRQNFYHDLLAVSIDDQGVDFTPNSGDKILAQEWYCDSRGHLKMAGGYGCSIMIDQTQKIEWECDQSTSSDCRSYQIESKFLTNGALGQSAEFVIEDDTGETNGNCPKATATTDCYDEWIDLSPVTMTGTALVVQGTSQTGKSVTTSTDPHVSLLTDTTASAPFEFGDRHFLITLPSGAVKWSGLASNIYYWDGSNFDNLTTPQESATARPGVIFGCASWIAVAPNSRGLTKGTPWTTGCKEAADGNYSVYQMQTGGAWVKMQSDIATQLAASPEGDIWALNAKGDILSWNGSKFVANPTGGCATSIGVGPNSRGLTHGTPWITGCGRAADGNYNVYQMQTDGKWVNMQSDVATRLAVSPEGNAWALNAKGDILNWNGSKLVANPTGGCAINIGVGPNSFGLTNGTPWVVGCTPAITPQGPPFNFSVYQMQSGGKWVEMQSGAGVGIAVSPEGDAWTITFPMLF